MPIDLMDKSQRYFIFLQGVISEKGCFFASSFLLLSSFCHASMQYTTEELKKFLESKKCENCDLTDASFSHEDLSNSTVSNSFLTRIEVSYTKIINADWRNNNFAYAAFHDDSDLRGSNFSGSTFSKAVSSFAHAENANFSNSKFISVDFRDSHFNGAQFINCSFKDAVLFKSNFLKANFSNTSFKNADLSHSNFSFGNFSGASFDGATLDKAILYGSNITIKQLEKVKSMVCTILPDGSVFTDNGNYYCN